MVGPPWATINALWLHNVRQGVGLDAAFARKGVVTNSGNPEGGPRAYIRCLLVW